MSPGVFKYSSHIKPSFGAGLSGPGTIFKINYKIKFHYYHVIIFQYISAMQFSNHTKDNGFIGFFGMRIQ